MAQPARKQKAMKWVSIIYRRSQGKLARRLEPFGIGRGQLGFLLRLSRADGLSQDELSSDLCFDKSATARALGRLERNGLIERRRDDRDGRVNRVYLTQKARRLKPELRRIHHEWKLTLFKGFSKQEEEAVLKGLRRMAKNVSEIADPGKDV